MVHGNAMQQCVLLITLCYSQAENGGGGEGVLYSALFVRNFAVSFISRHGGNVGHIIAIPVVYHTGKGLGCE